MRAEEGVEPWYFEKRGELKDCIPAKSLIVMLGDFLLTCVITSQFVNKGRQGLKKHEGKRCKLTA